MIDQEINEVVARNLGWTCCKHPAMENGKIVDAHGWVRPNGKACFHEALPDFCHSIAAAWEIVEKSDSIAFLTVEGTWQVHLDGQSAEAHTAPMAICLAFLKLKQKADVHL